MRDIAIVTLLRKRGPLTTADVAAVLGMRVAVISPRISDLCFRGILKIEGYVKRTQGRRGANTYVVTDKGAVWIGGSTK